MYKHWMLYKLFNQHLYDIANGRAESEQKSITCLCESNISKLLRLKKFKDKKKEEE